MAYNSDGYILFDFSDVDFRRTNQIIDGLYKRCVDVIGTNKFILIINANGRTPMPATCSYVNNQYVIDSFIYLFSITSNDNIFIRRNDVPASDIIDDSTVSVDTTWSSSKIDTELDAKQDTLTAGTNITIVDNVISATGGVEIDDTVIVNDKVWSSLNTVEKLAPIDTVIGTPTATFKTSLALPLFACNVTFSATQSGSGTPSPDNVRPFIGKSSLTVTANSVHVTKSLEGTYYKGSLNLSDGKLILDRWVYVFSGNESWTLAATNNFFALSLPITSDYYFKNLGNNVTSNGIVFRLTANGITIRCYIADNPSYIDVSTNMNTVMTNGIQLVYELNTPVEIQLTPEEIRTIIGNNAFTAEDNETITVSYKALPEDLI